MRPVTMLAAALVCAGLAGPRAERGSFGPGARVLLDAHNCYPYNGKWGDRLQRALSTDTPLAIEQDLFWFTDPQTRMARAVIAHEPEEAPNGPSLRDHFFERVRPIVERALAEGRRDAWPLVTLNLDLKSNEPAHHASIWETLGAYEEWLTTAERTADANRVMPLDVRPILVLTGSDRRQALAFHDRVAPGGRLRLFGAIATPQPPPKSSDEDRARFLIRQTPDQLIARRVTNYHRWVNFPWAVVEAGGQQYAGDWTTADRRRLQALVHRAHRHGLWIRFYTLNGHVPAEAAEQGWTASYNFGTPDAVRVRWQATIEAEVDFVATDQYEAFAAELKRAQVTAAR